MIRKVKVNTIRPNPFQHRKSMNEEAIKSLADEIKSTGFWSGALRGRERDGHVELCFGHRRLEAVKRLGWKEVDVDVVDLSDQDMALQALIENVQREGLDDAERGDGIKAYLRLKTGITDPSSLIGADRSGWINAKRDVAKILGCSEDRINELLSIADWDEEQKAPIRSRQIAGATALRMHRIAGKEGVTAAAKQGLSAYAVQAIGKELHKVTDAKIKEKIRTQIAEGKIAKPEEVITKARQFEAAVDRKKDSEPPMLVNLIRGWTERAHRWTEQARQVVPYVEQINEEPIVAKEWREAVAALIEELQKLSQQPPITTGRVRHQ
jgi:hypothetical protein